MNALDVQDRSRSPSVYTLEDDDVGIIKKSPSPKPKHYGMNTYIHMYLDQITPFYKEKRLVL